MAWRIVKQPNGLFARFSDVVDDFTHINMSETEALSVCKEEGCGEYEADKKMKAGKEDHIPWTEKPGSGLDRWNNSIDTIKTCHGEKIMKRRITTASTLFDID